MTMGGPRADGRLAGRVAIVTGAGRGLGRAHALRLAQEGAAVVVNDLGVTLQGAATARAVADEVVSEIHAAGGRAVASGHDVGDWGQAGDAVTLAVSTFGRLDLLVNNAGILRDRAFANMTEDDWDSVIRVNLKGHAAMSHHALAHWRTQHKSGATVDASIVHTTSGAGLAAKFGQANYAAAKLGIVGLSACLAVEGARYGVRSNAVAPSAVGTRMSLGDDGDVEAHAGSAGDPANVSPLVTWLGSPGCPATGQVFYSSGPRIIVSGMPPIHDRLRSAAPWTLAQLDAALTPRLRQLETSSAFHDDSQEHEVA